MKRENKKTQRNIKAWAIVTRRGKLLEWTSRGSGLRILDSKKEANDFFNGDAKYVDLNNADNSIIVPCVITFDLPKTAKRILK